MKQILSTSEFAQDLLNPEAADVAINLTNATHSKVLTHSLIEKNHTIFDFHRHDFEEGNQMEKSTLKSNYTTDFFNSDFNGHGVNPSGWKELEISDSKQIESQHTSLVNNDLGDIALKNSRKPNPADFLNQALGVINSAIELPEYKKKYQSGSRNPEFLYNYCYKLKNARELDSTIINEYLNTQSFTDLFSEKNLKFVYEFSLHNGKACIDVNSMVYRFMHDNISLFSPDFDLNQVKTRLMFIALDNTYKAIKDKDSKAFEFALDALSEYDNGRIYNYEETDGRITRWTTNKHLILTAEMIFYRKIGQFTKLQESIGRYINKIWNDADELNAFAYGYLKNSRNHSKLKMATTCVIRSIEINSNSSNTSTCALLLYKMERYGNALIYAKRALELAREEKLPTNSTAKLISLINKMAKRKQ